MRERSWTNGLLVAEIATGYWKTVDWKATPSAIPIGFGRRGVCKGFMSTGAKFPWESNVTASDLENSSGSERSRVSGVYLSLTRNSPSLSLWAMRIIHESTGKTRPTFSRTASLASRSVEHHLVEVGLEGTNNIYRRPDPAVDDDVIGLVGGAGRMTGPLKWDSI